MAAAATRRPKLSLQITPPACASSSIFGPSTMEPISAVEGTSSLPFGRSTAYTCETSATTPTTTLSSPYIPSPLSSTARLQRRHLSTPVSAIGGRPSRSSLRFSTVSSSDSEASEEENKFWSGEEISSATSSEDESSDSEKNSGFKMPITKPLESPFLPPAPTMTIQPKRKMQLRLITAITPASTTGSETFSPVVVAPSTSSFSSTAISTPTSKRARLSLAITIPNHPPSVTPTPANSRKSSLSSGSGRKKSVSFSPFPDSIIENTVYTLTNADLLSYLSSGNCSEAELNERWGMTAEDAKTLGFGGASRKLSSKERRERKWIGLTNDFFSSKKLAGDGQDPEEL